MFVKLLPIRRHLEAKDRNCVAHQRVATHATTIDVSNLVIHQFILFLIQMENFVVVLLMIPRKVAKMANRVSTVVVAPFTTTLSCQRAPQTAPRSAIALAGLVAART